MAHNTETSTSAIPNDPSDAGTADALLAALPPLLRHPPWLGKKRQNPLPVVEVVTIPTKEVLHWSAAELESFKHYKDRYHPSTVTDVFPAGFCLTAAGIERLQQGQPLLPGDVTHLSASAKVVLLLVRLSDPPALSHRYSRTA